MIISPGSEMSSELVETSRPKMRLSNSHQILRSNTCDLKRTAIAVKSPTIRDMKYTAAAVAVTSLARREAKGLSPEIEIIRPGLARKVLPTNSFDDLEPVQLLEFKQESEEQLEINQETEQQLILSKESEEQLVFNQNTKQQLVSKVVSVKHLVFNQNNKQQLEFIKENEQQLVFNQETNQHLILNKESEQQIVFNHNTKQQLLSKKVESPINVKCTTSNVTSPALREVPDCSSGIKTIRPGLFKQIIIDVEESEQKGVFKQETEQQLLLKQSNEHQLVFNHDQITKHIIKQTKDHQLIQNVKSQIHPKVKFHHTDKNPIVHSAFRHLKAENESELNTYTKKQVTFGKLKNGRSRNSRSEISSKTDRNNYKHATRGLSLNKSNLSGAKSVKVDNANDDELNNLYELSDSICDFVEEFQNLDLLFEVKD